MYYHKASPCDNPILSNSRISPIILSTFKDKKVVSTFIYRTVLTFSQLFFRYQKFSFSHIASVSIHFFVRIVLQNRSQWFGITKYDPTCWLFPSILHSKFLFTGAFHFLQFKEFFSFLQSDWIQSQSVCLAHRSSHKFDLTPLIDPSQLHHTARKYFENRMTIDNQICFSVGFLYQRDCQKFQLQDIMF